MKYIFFLLAMIASLLVFESCNRNSDPKPDTSGKFIKFFGTPGMSQANSMVETSDGFILVGYSVADFREDKDIFIVKTDKNGNRLWERRFGEKDEHEIARSVSIVNGQIWITGTDQQADGFYKAFVKRLNSSGNEITSFSYGLDSINFDSYHISAFDNGDFLIGGVRDTVDETNMFLTRITSSGNAVWENNVGVIGEKDSLSQIVMTQSGDLLWCGTAFRDNNITDIRIVHSTNYGGLLWSYEYGESGVAEYGRNIIQTSDGNFVVIGTAGNVGSSKLWTLKLNNNGAILEDKKFQENSIGTSIQELSTGGYIATGNVWKSKEDTDLLLLKLNSSLGVEWSKTFGGTRRDQGNAILEAQDGYFTMAGFTDLFQNINNVFYLVKTDTKGEINESKK